MASNHVFRRTLAGISLALLLASATAHAAEPSAAEKETARQLMDEGHIKYEQGDFEGALKDYRGADEIMHVTSTGLAMGKTLVQLGKLVEARDKLLEVTRIPSEPGESPILTKARDEAQRLQNQIADRIPAVKVEVTGITDKDKLSLRIGDEEVPTAAISLPQRVNPGRHTIKASYPGAPDVELAVTVSEGEVRAVKIELNPVDAGPPLDEGGEEGGELSPLVWVGFGVAGAGVIVGAITGGLSLKDASTAKKGCDGNICLPGQGDESAKKRSTTLAHVSTASFAVAGAGAALGLIALFVLSGDDGHEDEAPASGWTWRPLIGVGSVGVSGSF